MEAFDVAVVGGGSAGIAAAISAARCGARTLLLERDHRLGGNATSALVHTICGLYFDAEQEPRPAHPGFPRRMAEGLRVAGGAVAPERAGRVWALPISPPRFASFAADLCARTRGLDVRTGGPVVAVNVGPSARASTVETASRGGRTSIRTDIVIDATGDAVAGLLAGADVTMASAAELQCPSFIFRMGSVDAAGIEGFGRLKVSHAAAGAVRFGALPAGCESILVRPGVERGEVYVTLNVPKRDATTFDPLDGACVAELEERARDSATRIARYLRETRPEFRDGRITGWPARIGIRETRRLRGRAELDRDTLMRGDRAEDEVAVSTWPIELWHDHRRPHMEYPRGAASIPLGVLVSRSHLRLGMAGRCVSATHEALGALRVIGTSMATGEAIGVAAALASDAGQTIAEIAPAAVRRRILEMAEGEGRA